MRDLLFKNITSNDRKQRILVSSELVEQGGLRTDIHRHLVCRIEDVKKVEEVLPAPVLQVLKKKDTLLKTETFYCRIKGSMYMAKQDKLFLIAFIHSLRINLRAIPAEAGL